MCNLYTKAFVKTGMLDQNGRETYQEMPENIRPYVDCQRAVNEIALVNRSNGAVTYGIKSLFTVLQHRFPILKPLFKLRSFEWATDKSYKFISYNRRVIVPASNDMQNEAHCPGFSKTYRITYLLFAWLLTALIVHQYSSHLTSLLPASNLTGELGACGGQIVWQLLIVQLVNKRKAWDYLGNLMTISLAGSLVLGLIQLIGLALLIKHPMAYITGFGTVVFLMFMEHIRRTRLLKLGWIMTASWITYLTLLLLLIL